MSWGVNSGQGIIIGENKFGNENRDTDKPRILIALEDKASGSDRLSRQHSTTVAPGQGHYVTGVKLRDNLLAGSDGEKRGIVYSYIAQAGIIFDHNYHYGTPYPYLIEFAPGIKRLQDHTSGNTTYVYPQERDNKQWGSSRAGGLQPPRLRDPVRPRPVPRRQPRGPGGVAARRRPRLPAHRLAHREGHAGQRGGADSRRWPTRTAARPQRSSRPPLKTPASRCGWMTRSSFRRGGWGSSRSS